MPRTWASEPKAARQSPPLGRPVRWLISRESSTIPPGEDQNKFVNVYVNWYVCNGAVIPAFDDRDADRTAKALSARAPPDRDIV
jgi:agmatine/peptidylarginine deiminase